MALINLGPGDNALAGTAAPDRVNGGGGDDTVEGLGGADKLRGDTGADVVRGGGGDDSLAGGKGSDSVSGGAGNDTLHGNTGRDTLDGGDGDDLIYVGNGDDLVLGGAGADTVVIKGNSNAHTVAFGSDARGHYVVVNGPKGSDTIYGAERLQFNDTAVAICFYPGTRIATPAGEAAVETLRAGDVVLTADGRAAPVRWMGRQTVSARFGDPLRTLPVRVKAGALGEGLPARDLLVSPAHALLLGGVLVQAGALVNGATVVREAEVPETFTYWHVELADHGLILAEGVPAETFVDNADRGNFDNWAEHEALGPAGAAPEMDLPRAKSARQVPAAVRALLAERAAALRGGAAAAAAAA